MKKHVLWEQQRGKAAPLCNTRGYVRGGFFDTWSPRETYNFLLVMYVQSQFRTRSERPTQFSRRFGRMSCSTVSLPHNKCKRTRNDTLLASELSLRSLTLFVRAVSVQWLARKSDWNFSRNCFHLESCLPGGILFSGILLKNERFHVCLIIYGTGVLTI